MRVSHYRCVIVDIYWNRANWLPKGRVRNFLTMRLLIAPIWANRRVKDRAFGVRLNFMRGKYELKIDSKGKKNG